MFEAMKEIVSPAEMEEAVFTDDKQTREENIRVITDKLTEAFAENEEWLAILGEAVYQYEKKTVRKMILKDHKRPDGRDITQIRHLAAEIDLLPRAHGSAMFTRGQTQICNVCTLAPLSEQQKIDGLDENEVSKRYMHHYNFPSYSVGETKPSRGPGRREIGHGALAERALIPVLPSEDEFPYAIRTVSETFESNGSTSMASTCFFKFGQLFRCNIRIRNIPYLIKNTFSLFLILIAVLNHFNSIRVNFILQIRLICAF